MRRKGLLHDESGATLVEMAIMLPLFLGLLFAVIGFGLLNFTSARFNNALQTAAREIRTGQASPTDVQAVKALVCNAMGDSDCPNRLLIDVDSPGVGDGALADAPEVAAKPKGPEPKKPPPPKKGAPPPPPPPPPSDGAVASTALQPNAIVMITASYKWPLFLPFIPDDFDRTPDGQVLIISHLLFKNEPWNDQ